MLKFKKNGKVKAVLKDEASEPEGFKYLDDTTALDELDIPDDVLSLEELDEEEEEAKKNE